LHCFLGGGGGGGCCCCCGSCCWLFFYVLAVATSLFIFISWSQNESAKKGKRDSEQLFSGFQYILLLSFLADGVRLIFINTNY